jgi:S-adenosylmethionine:tRNA ribosyltransferase-isomerase
VRSQVGFTLPRELEADAPPEARGLRRDQVRLLVVDRASGALDHHRFTDLPWLLDPGDLVVVNDSRTLPASLLGRTAAGEPVEVRLAGRDGGRWAALPLGVPPGGGDPALVATDARPAPPRLAAGERLAFTGGLTATVLGRHEEAAPLVWLAFDAAGPALWQALHRAGRPVRYAYVPRAWGLRHYQTVFAAAPGSVEMVSAARPFSLQTVRELRRRGVELATVSLHAGLSTYGDPATDRAFVPVEEYHVPPATARAVNHRRASGGRVIAIGTSVVRALESCALEDRATAGAGTTRLRVTAQHRLALVDGLLTGFHEPEASHLDMLGAFLAPEVLRAAYQEAVAAGYLWHEFGDVCLLLPGRRPAVRRPATAHLALARASAISRRAASTPSNPAVDDDLPGSRSL